MSNDNDIENTSPEKKTIMNIYGAFAAALVLSLIPHGIAAAVCAVLGIGVLVAAYRARKKADAESLIENHMTFIIRTIWIGSSIAAIMTVLSGIYVYLNLDYEGLLQCGETTGSRDPTVMMSQCINVYLEDNYQLFLNGTIVAGVPALLYFIYRFFKGMARAIKGYRIAHPEAWF